ncbi:MAG: hypothetical protein NTY64_00305 [Deltaproteobacteria bacterium]|nr:hypothetical protein [Deltaproteobacteria bacterium]
MELKPAGKKQTPWHSSWVKIDGFVKSPSAALRFPFVVAAYHPSTPHSGGFARRVPRNAGELFTKPSLWRLFTRSSKVCGRIPLKGEIRVSPQRIWKDLFWRDSAKRANFSCKVVTDFSTPFRVF